MTRYEQGFMNKCAEYGLSKRQSIGLMKMAGLGLGSSLSLGLKNTIKKPAEKLVEKSLKDISALDLKTGKISADEFFALLDRLSKKDPGVS